MQAIKQIVDRVLVAAIFGVFAAFAWFAVAVAGAATGVSLGYDVWLQLWQPLFQPLLGLVMAGALISGAWGWIQKQREKFSK
ncbi:MAG: hypothetical protein AB4050_16020 [Synechococcus sp.]